MALATAHVEILADTSRFEKNLERQLSKSGAAAGKAFNKAFQKATARGAGGQVKIGRQYGAAGTKAGQQFARSFSKAASKVTVSGKITKGFTATVGNHGQSAGKRFGSGLLKGAAAPLAGIGKVVSTALSAVTDIGSSGGPKMFSGIAVAAGAAAAAVAPLAGLLAALPAAITGAGAAAATLAVAFSGMGEALQAGFSGDMAKFQKALNGLAPSAQNVAKEIVGLKPALDGLKASVQGAFFKPLVGQITQLSGVINGALKSGMTNLSKSLGQATAALARFFASPQAATALNTLFTGLANSVRAVTPGIVALTKGFLDMSAAGAASLGGIGPLMERIGAAMSGFANGGGLTKMLQAAGAAAQQLGAAFAGLWPGLKAMMGPINTIGAAVRAALIPAFHALGQAMVTLAPVFNQIFGILGSVLQAVIPPLAVAFTGLAKILAALLGPALKVLGPIIMRIAHALGPMLTQALQAIIPKLVQLAHVAGPVLAEALKAVGWAVNMLLPIFQSFANNVVPIFNNAFLAIIGIFKVFQGILTGDWSRMWEGLKQLAINGLRAIGHIFRGAGTLLLDAGKAIVQGLIDGAAAVWNRAKSFFGGMTNWIKQNKGPLPYDRRLLVPAGRAIMKGFGKGIRSEWGDVARTVRGITKDLPKITMPVNAHTAAANPMLTRAPLGEPGRRDQRPVEHHRTTTVNAPISVRSSSVDPARVARRTSDRLARLTTA